MRKKSKNYAAPVLESYEVAVIMGFGASNPWDEVNAGEAGGEIATGDEWNL